eukprot:TRINITY_DN748_c0_g1_i11.p1 TRINITY_DN748_c0_g1~~TRINITY_DN748_c0_g1_i11.p1  ORF type:complete len:567 (-),score=106.04 TRINITY_DN748_c0_g1_i11:152-1801(-)
MVQLQYLLFESASGFSLFEITEFDVIAKGTDAIQESIRDYGKFSKMVRMIAFKPYGSPAEALEQINSVSESIATELLCDFLLANLPKVKEGKKPKWNLGIGESKLAAAIMELTSIPCTCNDMVGEALRGVRLHFTTLVKQIEPREWVRAQLGLSHAYSRAKVKFNVNRADNMIIQAIALLDTLDKDINTFVMKVREWYSWHFPELLKVVSDNYQFSRLVLAIQDKSQLTEEKLGDIQEIVEDEDKAREVLEAAKASMGQDISEIDLVNISLFAKRVISLAEYRIHLQTYLLERMNAVAPNLSSLIGETVGARLISHAGSLTNLAKYPASTVQILGAEKALFRAIKTKGNTPKYGLIFHSTFIGRAKQKNKGRISRYLANKCSIASRIDCFSDVSSSAFGERMRQQVEDRLKFYEEGVAPTKNEDAMKEALSKMREELGMDEDQTAEQQAQNGEEKKKKKKKKRKAEEMEGGTEEPEAEVDKPKKKKQKKAAQEQEEVSEPVPVTNGEEKPQKKKKKKGNVEQSEVTEAVETETPIVEKPKKKKKKQKAE